ncbi:MAG: cold shock domain-containing protein [Desulfococcaceae bacterium]|nr:cold shock domain-containing protein [Desulfococcaceae bacterium]
MTDQLHRGKLTVWKDDKGFGFIKPENGTQNVFIHISELRKMPRRPAEGDMILYHLSTDRQGKQKAADAVIEGLEPVRHRQRKVSGSAKSGSLFKRFVFITIIIISVILYGNLSENNDFFKDISITAERIYSRIVSGELLENIQIPKEIKNFAKPEPASDTYTQAYQCQGKIWCSEMTSCEEAVFYLRNCPGVKIDGDRDGIPCESQWCGQ